MTLYIDNKLKFAENDVVSTVTLWHPAFPLLAVGSFSQEKGGFAIIFHENGLPLKGYDWPTLQSNQVTALAWHPLRKLLVVGWDRGEIFIWLESSWARLDAPHSTAVTMIQFSPGGRRLITADAGGSVCGWNASTGAPLTSYHHQLPNVIMHLSFCAPLPSSEGMVRGLARAAVAGDDRALDALAAWRPRTTVRIREGSQLDNMTCFAALENGSLIYLNTAGDITEVFSAPGVVQFMHTLSVFYLLVAWENAGALGITKLNIGVEGSLTSESHVRMTARSGQAVVIAGEGTVAVLAGDTVIRYWNSENGDNGVLPIEPEVLSHSDIFTSIAYCELSDTLCCGTAQGHLYFWKRDPMNAWKLMSRTSVRGTVKHIGIGSRALIQPLISVNCITSIFILEEQTLCWGYSSNCSIVQKSASDLAVLFNDEKKSSILSNLKIKSIAFKSQYLALTDGERIEVWSNSKEHPYRFALLHTFPWKTEFILIHEDLLVGLATPHIECKTISGNSVGMLPTAEGEGDPVGITGTNSFIVIATLDGCLKVGEISKKGIRLMYPPKNCFQVIDDFGEIMHAAVNSSGHYVSFSIANAALTPDSKVYIWDCTRDLVQSYILYENDINSFNLLFVPAALTWDAFDPRILIIHIRSIESEDLIMNFCDDGKMYQHKDWLSETDFLNSDFLLCGLQTPHVVVLIQQNISRIKIKEFLDINEPNATMTRQVLDFIFNMTVGRLEKAVLVASNLAGGKSRAIWSGLAKACVKAKRPDVSAVCLAKMGDFKGALMLREAMNDPSCSVVAQTGILAVNLNLLDEAERLFKESNRTDLLARLYSARGKELNEIQETEFAGEAILIRKSVQFRIAKSLWASDDIAGAVNMFERAGATLPHIPKVLLSVGQHALEQYVANCTDKDVIKWWGNYLESLGDLENALEAYARIDDFASQTRLLCHIDKFKEAEVLCEKNRGAAFQMARYLEMQDENLEKTVKLYLQCGVVSAALRLALESQNPTLIWRAGIAKPSYAVIAAETLQYLGENGRAISLYQNAGQPLAALELALSLNDLNAACDCVDSVCSRGHVTAIAVEEPARILRDAGCTAHAAALLAAAEQFSEAIESVEADATGLTEELADKLVPPVGTADREKLLRRLADVMGSRGFYKEAARRLAQAGDKNGALRWLLRSGDVDKVAAFATASRDKAVQITAASYLRSHGEWQSQSDVYKQIIQLYTKAKAHDQLASFYAETAKYEIDEYANFEKALDDIKQAIRCINKTADLDLGRQATILQEQCTLLKAVLELKHTLENGDLRQGINGINQLLNAVKGRPGLLAEENILKLAVKLIGGTPDGKVFADRLKAATIAREDQSENGLTDHSDHSIEENI